MNLLKFNKLIINKSYRHFSILFSKTHEYVKINKNLCTIGISKYAEESLGDIVHIDFQPLGKIIKKNDMIAEIDSVKAVSEIISPVSGKIIKINNKVIDNPSLINSSPLDNGWLIKINLDENIEDSKLLNETEYNEYINLDFDHLKKS